MAHKTDIIVQKEKYQNTVFENVYFKNVPIYYAKVQEAAPKYQDPDHKEYSLDIFIDDDSLEKLDELIVNKQTFKVGVDKNKFKNVKYPEDTFELVKGLNGLKLSLPELKKDGTANRLLVVKDKAEFKELLGNGTVVTIKCSGWRNKEGLLNISPRIISVVDHVPYEKGPVRIKDDILGIDIELEEPKTEAELDQIEVNDDEFI